MEECGDFSKVRREQKSKIAAFSETCLVSWTQTGVDMKRLNPLLPHDEKHSSFYLLLSPFVPESFNESSLSLPSSHNAIGRALPACHKSGIERSN